ncbi:MAG: diaminopimelate decarboxylase [Vicingaceae bacterium]
MFQSKEINFFKSLKTPFYYYDMEVLNATLEACKKASEPYGFEVHYALKANANDKILQLITNKGFGADCVSGNEILKAVEIGFPKNKIAFAGVGKTDDEINIALENDIFCLNCESIAEIKVINELAQQQNKVAPIALRINPNVNANTHHYITTGLEENKFGINFWELEDVLEVVQQSKYIQLIGLHFHIGSQINDLSVFKGLCLRVNEIQQWFWSRKYILPHINVGGGLGIDYKNTDKNYIPDFEAFFKIFKYHLVLQPGQQLHFELGRSLVATCGSLIAKVLYIKEGVKTNFAIIDAGMTELIRPALYQAVHSIEVLTSTKEPKKYDVVGPICESSDCFAKSIYLPELKRGDLIAVRAAGAYGEVMASTYNLRSLVKAYYSDEVTV